MAVIVVTTREYEAWYADLPGKTQARIDHVVSILKEAGTVLPFPFSSQIQGPLRELRIKAHGRQVRIFYAFDKVRNAVLLIGGDKTGDDRFYDRMIPVAQILLDAWTTALDAGKFKSRKEDS